MTEMWRDGLHASSMKTAKISAYAVNHTRSSRTCWGVGDAEVGQYC